MDIRKYQLFADVAETRNFTRSGARLGYSQSGVSHILKSMEDEIGILLFTRSRHGVRLTPDAMQLLPFVHTVLKDYAVLTEQIYALSSHEAAGPAKPEITETHKNFSEPAEHTDAV